MNPPAVRTPLRVSLRARLTLIYGALFLATGAVLLATTYLLTADTMNRKLTAIALPKTLFLVQTPSDQPTAAKVQQMQAMRSTVERIVEQRVQQQKSDVLWQLVQSSLLIMVVLGLIAIGLSYVVAGRALAPLQHVTAAARRLSESTLHERIGLKGPRDEIKELADTFDAMLDRLHRAFDSQRRFVANASHELRTPLTVNRTVLEVAIAARRTPEETRVMARALLDNTARHERLIEGLLLLARSERGLTTRTPVPLHDTARAALDQLAGRTEEGRVAVTAYLSPAHPPGDPVLLEHCAMNLVENAIKYNVPGGEVVVSTGRVPGGVELRVENTGPPVPPQELDRIFEPFRRLGADRTGSARGAGLGLSIVRSVVHAHGGSVHAVPRPGGGLTVTVRLPATGPRAAS